jgi:predicted RNA-binding protein with PUA-like domain
MAYWLMKSEPFVYSWSKLVKDGKGSWDGVRNHLAKRNLMSMKIGDLAFFYHSNEGLEIVGIMRISKLAHPDPTDKTGKFVQVGVEPVAAMPLPVTLKSIKADPKLAEMALVKQMRLSVQPVTAAEWKRVCQMGGYKY